MQPQLFLSNVIQSDNDSNAIILLLLSFSKARTLPRENYAKRIMFSSIAVLGHAFNLSVKAAFAEDSCERTQFSHRASIVLGRDAFRRDLS